MKIQYICSCGSKFLGMTEEGRSSGVIIEELNFICDSYEKFKTRHASCHEYARGSKPKPIKNIIGNFIKADLNDTHS